jgi:sugar O-acyltransferase (sialic acid O-acetyltransferase NeuD family)
MKDLIIIGASGFGREAMWVAERMNEKSPEWNILGFLDDNAELKGQTVGGYPVLGGVDDAALHPDAYYLCAIGASKVREKIISRVDALLPDAHYATLIDPTVQMSKRVRIGEGTIICAGNIITVDIEIGKHIIINLDCTVGHDAVLHDFVTLYPSVNVSGISEIGRCTELGTGAQIIQAKTVGEYTIVGAGAVVVKDIPAKCTAVGSPAKPIKFFE